MPEDRGIRSQGSGAEWRRTPAETGGEGDERYQERRGFGAQIAAVGPAVTASSVGSGRYCARSRRLERISSGSPLRIGARRSVTSRRFRPCSSRPMTPDGKSVDESGASAPAAAAVETLASPLPTGADPDAVLDWFDLETIVDLPAPAASFAEAEAAAADYRRAARAENTRRAYRAAVARFTEWCAAHGQTALPASPQTVAAFLAAEAGRGLAVNTLRLRHAALRYLHLLAGYPPPTASPLVSATFAGIRRAHRRPLRKKTALDARPAARRRAADPRHLARAARPRAAARRFRRGAAPQRTGGA